MSRSRRKTPKGAPTYGDDSFYMARGNRVLRRKRREIMKKLRIDELDNIVFPKLGEIRYVYWVKPRSHRTVWVDFDLNDPTEIENFLSFMRK